MQWSVRCCCLLFPVVWAVAALLSAWAPLPCGPCHGGWGIECCWLALLFWKASQGGCTSPFSSALSKCLVLSCPMFLGSKVSTSKSTHMFTASPLIPYCLVPCINLLVCMKGIWRETSLSLTVFTDRGRASSLITNTHKCARVHGQEIITWCLMTHFCYGC